MDKQKQEIKNAEFTYNVKGKTFIVRPVYKDRGGAIDKMLLRLMCDHDTGRSGRVQ